MQTIESCAPFLSLSSTLLLSMRTNALCEETWQATPRPCGEERERERKTERQRAEEREREMQREVAEKEKKRKKERGKRVGG